MVGSGSGAESVRTNNYGTHPDRGGSKTYEFVEHCFFPSFLNFFLIERGVQMLGTRYLVFLFELQFKLSYKFSNAFE